jgi:hypothetical protein
MPVPDVEHASIIGFDGWVQVSHGSVYHFYGVASENGLDGRRWSTHEMGHDTGPS